MKPALANPILSLATAILTLTTLTTAQRPSNTSICDYYASTLLGENNITTQAIVLTLIVNTALIGNYTEPNLNITVPGILGPAEYEGQKVNLLPYFDGSLNSSNPTGGVTKHGLSVNWLDGGGDEAWSMNQLGEEGSHQSYVLHAFASRYPFPCRSALSPTPVFPPLTQCPVLILYKANSLSISTPFYPPSSAAPSSPTRNPTPTTSTPATNQCTTCTNTWPFPAQKWDISLTRSDSLRRAWA
jgi:hypothetical protein